MEIKRRRTVLRFIATLRSSHSDMDKIFKYGSCWELFLLLRVVFPSAKPWYNEDHVITEIFNTFYDITGEVSQEGYSRMAKEQFSRFSSNKNLRERRALR